MNLNVTPSKLSFSSSYCILSLYSLIFQCGFWNLKIWNLKYKFCYLYLYDFFKENSLLVSQKYKNCLPDISKLIVGIIVLKLTIVKQALLMSG